MDAALDTIVPAESNLPYDIKDVIHRVVDDGEFFEVHEHWAKNLVVGFARMDGRPIGIVANQPAFLAGRAGYQFVGEGRALRALLRRLQYPDPDVRRCARAFCPARSRSSAASSGTARNCCTRMPRPPSRRSR